MLDDEFKSTVLAEVKVIRQNTDHLVSILNEFLPLMRKAAAIKAMNPAAKVREVMAKRGNTRSLSSGTYESSGEGGSVTRRIVPDERPGGIGESD